MNASRNGNRGKVPFWTDNGEPGKIGPSYIKAIDALPETMDVMPSQFHAAAKDHRTEKERSLMLATLEQAVDDYKRCAHSKKVRAQLFFEETCRWFEDRENIWPYSFVNICVELDIDPDRVYTKLCRWRQSNIKTASPFVRRRKTETCHGRKHASR